MLDTNIWVFGLHAHPEKPACARLLESLALLRVVLPRQVLRELQANLTPAEMNILFALLRALPHPAEVHWEMSAPHLVSRYQDCGCKLGDAAVAAQAEELQATALISENRHFLSEAMGLPFRTLSAEEALR